MRVERLISRYEPGDLIGFAIEDREKFGKIEVVEYVLRAAAKSKKDWIEDRFKYWIEGIGWISEEQIFGKFEKVKS